MLHRLSRGRQIIYHAKCFHRETFIKGHRLVHHAGERRTPKLKHDYQRIYRELATPSSVITEISQNGQSLKQTTESGCLEQWVATVVVLELAKVSHI